MKTVPLHYSPMLSRNLIMTHKYTSPAGRRRLLLGGALAAFSATLASSAFADVDASGAKVIVSDQRQASATVSANAANPVILASGQPTASSIAVATNSVSATATGNNSTASMTPDALDLAAASGGANLSTGADGSWANAPALITTRQMATGTDVSATTAGSLIGASLGRSSNSSAAVTGNTQEAIALANQANDTLALSGQTVSTGAGILSDQSIAGNAAVAVGTSARINLKAIGDSGDALSLSGNLQRAIGYGNATTNDLSADAVSVAAAPSWASPSTIASGSDPQVNAAYAVLSDQRLGSRIAASAKGGFDVKVRGNADTSSIANNANTLAAAGYGNEVADSLSLTADGVATNPLLGGAVANITNVQQVASVPVTATASGGARVQISGAATDTSLAASNNSVLAVATANQADGNLLTVSATSLDAGASMAPIMYAVGTAQVDESGTQSVTAPFSVQNAQTQSGSVAAEVINSTTAISVGSDVAGSSLAASGNSTSSAATANAATNGLTLDGTNVATAADLNSFQSANGGVAASVGSASNPAGVLVVGHGNVTDAALTVSGNSLAANATGNNAGNTMAITGNSLASVSGHTDAQAGVLDAGTGAAADFALANTQQLGGLYAPGVESASTSGSFAAIAAQGASDSALAVTDNSQSASALGNGATNALSLSATNLGSDAALAPGSALSSAQTANTNVSASSDMRLGLSSTASGSSLSLIGNTNTASAGINAVTNSLAVDTVNAGSLSDQNAGASAAATWPVQVTGDEVLANSQTAQGSVTARALTNGMVGGFGATLTASGFEASRNATSAAASANAAANTLSLTAASDREASAGLANVQTSSAAVNAVAVNALGYGSGSVTNAQALIENNVTAADARGNEATNALTVTGGSAAPVLASITTGALNSLSASGALLNVQTNSSAVMAASYGPTAVINAGGTGASVASLGANGNSVTAAAYGNSATNSITLASLSGLPTSGATNVQANSGPVSAMVSDATYSIASGPLTSSRASLVGNVISASAVGNAATNMVATAR